MSFLSQIFGSSRFKSLTFTNYETVPKLPVIAHRLKENIRWECSACHAQVSSEESHLHVIPCLMSSISRTKVENSDEKLFVRCRRAKSMETSKPEHLLCRPKTKRLDRPTPNLRHPVIDISDGSPSSLSESQLTVRGSNTKTEKCVKSKSKTSLEKAKSRSLDDEENQEMTGGQVIGTKEALNVGKGVESKSKGKPTPLTGSTSQGQGRVYSQSAVRSKSTRYPKKQNSLVETKPSKDTKKGPSLTEKNVTKSEGPRTRKTEGQTTLLIKDSKSTQNQGSSAASELKSITSRLQQDWEHFNSQLSQCLKCGRTFFPHRLEIHEKACRGSTNPETSNKVTKNNEIIRPPQVHIELKPNNASIESVKTTLTLDNRVDANDDEKSEYLTPEDQDDGQWLNHLEELKPCTRCKRTFFPDRLEKHEPHCKAKPVQVDNTIPQ